MKKREWIIVVVVIVLGMAYHYSEKGCVHWDRNFSFVFNSTKLLSDQFFDYQINEKTFLNIQEISITNPAGEINVTRGNDQAIHLSSLIRVYHDHKTKADEFSKSITIGTNVEQGRLGIIAQSVSDSIFPVNRVRIHHKIAVPDKIYLQINNKYGNTIIENTNSKVEVNNHYGNTIVKNTMNDVIFDTHYADVIIENALSIQGKGKYSNYSIKNITENVFIETAYGKLELETAESAELTTKHTRVFVKNLKKDLKLTDSYEKILIENVAGSINLSTKYCKIDLLDSQCETIGISNKYDNVNISNSSTKTANISMKHGNINVELTGISDQITISGDYCDTRLVLPLLSNASFHIRTRYGKIVNNTSKNLETYEEGPETYVDLSDQKPEIFVKANYGDIILSEKKIEPKKAVAAERYSP